MRDVLLFREKEQLLLSVMEVWLLRGRERLFLRGRERLLLRGREGLLLRGSKVILIRGREALLLMLWGKCFTYFVSCWVGWSIWMREGGIIAAREGGTITARRRMFNFLNLCNKLWTGLSTVTPTLIPKLQINS